jgi:hypothetical protein
MNQKIVGPELFCGEPNNRHVLTVLHPIFLRMGGYIYYGVEVLGCAKVACRECVWEVIISR